MLGVMSGWACSHATDGATRSWVRPPTRIFGTALLPLAAMAAATLTTAPTVLAQTLSVGSKPFSPSYNQTRDGVEGILVDLMERLVRRHHRVYRTTHAVARQLWPTERMFAMIEHGDIDLTIRTKADQLEQHDAIGHTGTPIMRLSVNAYHRPSTPTISTVADFAQHAVGAMRGHNLINLRACFEDQANAVDWTDVDQYTSALRMVDRGRISYAVMYDFSYNATIDKVGLQGELVASPVITARAFL